MFYLALIHVNDCFGFINEKYSENNIIYSDFDVYDMILQNFLHKLSHLPYEDYKEVEFMKSLLERA